VKSVRLKIQTRSNWKTIPQKKKKNDKKREENERKMPTDSSTVQYLVWKHISMLYCL